MDPKPIVLFDGVCNLCSGSVQFILKRDKNNLFQFASLQSKPGQEYLKKFNLPADTFNSFVLVEGDNIYTRSTAALRIAKNLKGWKWLYAFRIVPKFIRDAVYNLIAKNRYRWFGKKNECWIPTPDLRARFLEYP
jgi:predicted DCC family thiol-disulfide oxidoreductase YuxK